MAKQKRGFRRKTKEHDKHALRRIPVEPVKGIPRKRSVVQELLDPPKVKKPKVDPKAEEELRNQGKVLCGVLHPKNKLACVVPVDEHGDKHETWNLTRGGNVETYSKLQWDVKA